MVNTIPYGPSAPGQDDVRGRCQACESRSAGEPQRRPGAFPRIIPFISYATVFAW